MVFENLFLGSITGAMKYTKGTMVEVLSKRELPSGSWWRAEIISGNGHTYSVKYYASPSGMGEPVERVPNKAIRPCPPLLQGPFSWAPGDVVELFDNGSWKLAQVASAVDASYLFVRLLGSSTVFMVHKSDLRLRQCWQDNRWVVISKDVRSSDGGGLLKHGCLQMLGCKKWKDSMKVHNFEESTSIEEAKWARSGGKKRGLQYCLPPPEARHRSTKKLKSEVHKEGRHQRLAAVYPYFSRDKVDAVAPPQKLIGEKCMHPSLNNRTVLSDVNMERGKLNDDVGYFFVRSLEGSEASVCSSSGSNDLVVSCCHPFTTPCVDGDSMSDDADSSGWPKLGIKQTVPTRDLAAQIHNLEFHAYRTTMEALYLCGPITWEQEELMTNLRLELHISNDEHLSVLRHLSSSELDLFSYVDAAPQLLKSLSIC